MSWFRRPTPPPKDASLDTFYSFYEGEIYKQINLNKNNPTVKEKLQYMLQDITPFFISNADYL